MFGESRPSIGGCFCPAQRHPADKCCEALLDRASCAGDNTVLAMIRQGSDAKETFEAQPACG